MEPVSHAQHLCTEKMQKSAVKMIVKKMRYSWKQVSVKHALCTTRSLMESVCLKLVIKTKYYFKMENAISVPCTPERRMTTNVRDKKSSEHHN